MNHESGKRKGLIFTIALILIAAGMLGSVVKTNMYNRVHHHATFTGMQLVSSEGAEDKPVSVTAVPRGSTWTKVFDLNGEGLTEHNYQAYTYDFTVANHTGDEVADFSFQMTFNRVAYLMSAWNGALEFHQHVRGEEKVDTIPDLRDYNPADYQLDTVVIDGDTLVPMEAGDYLKYIPSTSANAREMPIGPYEATTPGCIIYLGIGEDLYDSVLVLNYTFHRLITSEPLFWISLVCLAVWLIALIIVLITSAQVRKYQEQHERDNRIINESIETFTGFIDAKDPYTNGHSKRVAIYTRRIAQEFGYEGEELDRIYYIALLHDCGKIGVPDQILTKPGKLTDEEYAILKSHSARGGEILSSFKSLKDVGEGARYHHERYDGRGYPDGKAGEDIPFIARMICVADSFDAMNSNRVYRKKLTREHIINEIEVNKGRQFDPKVADVMLRLIREGEIKVGD